MPADPKRKHLTNGWGSVTKKRAITIHDGTRLTPALVRVLAALTDEVEEHLDARLDTEQTGRGARVAAPESVRQRLDPVLVARADGLAIYVDTEGELL